MESISTLMEETTIDNAKEHDKAPEFDMLSFLPKDLQQYFLSNVRDFNTPLTIQIVSVKDLCTLRLISHSSKRYIDLNDSVWKNQFAHNFPTLPSPNKINKSTFVETWRLEKYNSWDINCPQRQTTFKHNNRHVIHGIGTYFLPLRTKFGNVMGDTKM